MKKVSLLILLLYISISCKNDKIEINLDQLNGYWEINEVTLLDGTKKEYKMNETVDYFDIQNSKGFRKKVTPQFDGTFLINNEAEAVEIKDSAAFYFLEYKTNYATWTEKIERLTDSVLILKNKQGLRYQYKRHVPFSVKYSSKQLE